MFALRPSAAETDLVEKELELALPDDLFEFARCYGSGEFRTNEHSLVLAIENPFSRHFVPSARKLKKQLSAIWERYEVYPNRPGLFPCGTGNGPRDLYFYTDGAPNHWPLVTAVSVSQPLQMQLSMLEYLFRLFDASLEGEASEVDNRWFSAQRGSFGSSRGADEERKKEHRTFRLLFQLAAKKITGMPRTARASRAGYCHHVLSRGNARKAVFHKDGDFAAFVKLPRGAIRGHRTFFACFYGFQPRRLPVCHAQHELPELAVAITCLIGATLGKPFSTRTAISALSSSC